DGRFCVKDVRCLLDDVFLPKAETMCFFLKRRFLRGGLNLFRLKSMFLLGNFVLIGFPLGCDMAKDVMFLVSRWWDLEDRRFGSFQEWLAWFNSIRFGAKSKGVLEGVFYISWWSIWNLRNLLLLRSRNPRLLLSLNYLYLLFVTVLVRKSVIEPEIVTVTELETTIVTQPETGTVTGVDIAIVTEAETAIVTEAETAILTDAETAIVTESKTVPETVLVTEPVNVFVIVIETGSLAHGLRFENHVVQFQEPPVWT
nr:RNA-directed DNA polymerase, eukaryota [Tanacetum cinerariifolium]